MLVKYGLSLFFASLLVRNHATNLNKVGAGAINRTAIGVPINQEQPRLDS